MRYQDNQGLVVSSSSAAVAAAAPSFISDVLATTYSKQQALRLAREEKGQIKQDFLDQKQAAGEDIGYPDAIANKALLIDIGSLNPNQNYAYAGFTGLNLIENKDSIAYLASKVSTKVADAIYAVPHLAWTAGYFLSSLGLAYGAGATNLLKIAAINTGVFEARKLISYIFSSEQDVTPTPAEAHGALGFISQYSDNIIFDVVSTLVQTAAIATISRATLGIGGIAIPVAMTVATDLIKYYNVYNDYHHKEYASLTEVILPTLAAIVGTALYLKTLPTQNLADIDQLSNGFHKIQLAIGLLTIAASSYHIGDLLYDSISPVFSSSTHISTTPIDITANEGNHTLDTTGNNTLLHDEL